MPTITRQQLIDAIEEGIKTIVFKAGATNEQRADLVERLREVGRTADKVAVGTFVKCGCPLTQAGAVTVGRPDDDADTDDPAFGCGFVSAFDFYVDDIIGQPYLVAYEVDIVG